MIESFQQTIREAAARRAPLRLRGGGSKVEGTASKLETRVDDGPKKSAATGAEREALLEKLRSLKDELARLWKVERPPIVTTVTWAAGNGDRSENGDYIYGKRKLREIDRRIRFLSKRLDQAVVVDNAGKTHGRVHFGATVTIADEYGDEREVTIVGVDELDTGDARVSWRSPLARALLTAKVGDMVTVRAPRGPEQLEIVAIRYDDLG